MATDGPTPPGCDQEIFDKGEPIVLIDGSSNAVERWVKAVAAEANARLDWHYSGGMAQVLHLGDAESRARADAAITRLESSLSGTIMRRLPAGATGLYRQGVTPVPDGAIAGFYDGGDSSTYIVER
jgi:hypothetical protein